MSYDKNHHTITQETVQVLLILEIVHFFTIHL